MVKIRREMRAAEPPICDRGTGFRDGDRGVVSRGALPVDSALAKPRALDEAQTVDRGESEGPSHSSCRPERGISRCLHLTMWMMGGHWPRALNWCATIAEPREDTLQVREWVEVEIGSPTARSPPRVVVVVREEEADHDTSAVED